MSEAARIKEVLRDVLQLGDRILSFNESSPLLGNVPELDSMAVVAVISALEERFGFTLSDDELTGETFRTLGSLTRFVEQKLKS